MTPPQLKCGPRIDDSLTRDNNIVERGTPATDAGSVVCAVKFQRRGGFGGGEAPVLGFPAHAAGIVAGDIESKFLALSSGKL